MKVWRENYGEDADGNRGEMRNMYELDDSKAEREQIIEKLVDVFKDDWALGESVSLCLTDDCGDGEYECDLNVDEYAAEVIAILNKDDDCKELEYTLAIRDFEIEWMKRIISTAKLRGTNAKNMLSSMVELIECMEVK